MTPSEREELKEVLLDLIRNDPEIHYSFERIAARNRFERINGIGGECTCQR